MGFRLDCDLRHSSHCDAPHSLAIFCQYRGAQRADCRESAVDRQRFLRVWPGVSLRFRSGVADAQHLLERVKQVHGLERLGQNQVRTGTLGGCQIGRSRNCVGLIGRDTEVAAA